MKLIAEKPEEDLYTSPQIKKLGMKALWRNINRWKRMIVQGA